MLNLAEEYPLTARGLFLGAGLASLSSSLLLLWGATPKIWFVASWMFMGGVLSLLVLFRRYAAISAAVWAAILFYAAHTVDDASQQELAKISAVIVVAAFAVIGFCQIKGLGRESFFAREKASWKDWAIFVFVMAILFALASGVYLPRPVT